jgi:hypothetical protein
MREVLNKNTVISFAGIVSVCTGMSSSPTRIESNTSCWINATTLEGFYSANRIAIILCP